MVQKLQMNTDDTDNNKKRVRIHLIRENLCPSVGFILALPMIGTRLMMRE